MINLTGFPRREFEAAGIYEPHQDDVDTIIELIEDGNSTDDEEVLEDIVKDMLSISWADDGDEVLIWADWNTKFVNTFKRICSSKNIKLYTLEKIRDNNTSYYYKEKFKIERLV